MKKDKEKELINDTIDFLAHDPDNVYRTKDFIVAQHISLAYDEAIGAVSVSDDVFYKRTASRDMNFDFIQMGEQILEGRRVPTQSYIRRYVR